MGRSVAQRFFPHLGVRQPLPPDGSAHWAKVREGSTYPMPPNYRFHDTEARRAGKSASRRAESVTRLRRRVNCGGDVPAANAARAGGRSGCRGLTAVGCCSGSAASPPVHGGHVLPGMPPGRSYPHSRDRYGSFVTARRPLSVSDERSGPAASILRSGAASYSRGERNVGPWRCETEVATSQCRSGAGGSRRHDRCGRDHRLVAALTRHDHLRLRPRSFRRKCD
jgi:hypothetical protein